ncbi:MAG: signal recognition particle protein [Clostridia bacterium]|jgi:signal recognition particle subunit SRP54|nr:signal recognition particle protein [Clostridia bacterium]
MGLFSGLSEKLNHIFSKLTARGKLTELEIKQAMREIRIALLEADVNLSVVKDFISRVSQQAVGEKIMNSLTPGQQVIKIVNEEMIALMGSTNSALQVASKPPTVIMMCGLQGAGKTTMCGKLALMLKKQGKKPLLVAGDIYRPAAINQLQVVGKNVGAEVYEHGVQKPYKTALEALKIAEKKGLDTVIIDTAGRLHINDELMKELEDVKREVKPTEILLTVDAMTGQDAVTVATTFNDRLDISGVILTKLDGDTRGGAALSIKAVTGKPIKFCGTGEKMGDIEVFHPERMASRILGMGDVLTLIEKAQNAVTEEEMEKLEKKFRESNFTLDDFLTQFDNISKMGDLSQLISMMPGLGGNVKISEKDIDEKRIARFKAIIQSMTMYEREHPEIIKSSRRKRIAAGSGTTIQDVNQLLKQFEQSKDMMRAMKGGKRMPFRR